MINKARIAAVGPKSRCGILGEGQLASSHRLGSLGSVSEALCCTLPQPFERVKTPKPMCGYVPEKHVSSSCRRDDDSCRSDDDGTLWCATVCRTPSVRCVGPWRVSARRCPRPQLTAGVLTGRAVTLAS